MTMATGERFDHGRALDDPCRTFGELAPALVAQLRPGGRMVSPLGGAEARALAVRDKGDRGPARAGGSSRPTSAGWRRWGEPYVPARPG
jgi:hypothetical protein